MRACACACVCESARPGGMGDQVSVRAPRPRARLPPYPHPRAPPELPSRGRPRGGAASIYSPSVPPLAASFLPARPAPPHTPRQLSVPRPLSPVALGRLPDQVQGRGAQDRPSPFPGSEGVPSSDPPWGAGVGWQAGFGGGSRVFACLVRAFGGWEGCPLRVGSQEGLKNDTFGEWGLQRSPAFGHSGIWSPGFYG